MRVELQQMLYPCFVATTGVAVFGTVTGGPAILIRGAPALDSHAAPGGAPRAQSAGPRWRRS